VHNSADSLNEVISPKWYTTEQVALMLGYGLTKTKHLILSGQIRSVKDGGNRRILPEWVDDYIRHKIEEATA
jgi:excisionase family DNA binding protein